MRTILAILAGKTVSILTKAFKIGGGSAAPGLYALKIDPSLIKKLACKIPLNIVITGTNGKTTTARMLAHFAKAQGLKVIRNHTGSNLERGIASTLILNSHLTSGKLDFDLGIWELDEAAFNSSVLNIKPTAIVFLNAFRDQLDRYGEVDSVVNKWCETLKLVDPSTTVIINGDDGNLKLQDHFKGKILTFGTSDHKIQGEKAPATKIKLNIEAKNIKTAGLSGTSFVLDFNRQSLNVDLPVPGIYHIYDFLAAFALGIQLKLNQNAIINSLATFSPAFGRVEKFTLQPGRLQVKNEAYIFLIKNPVGANQVLETIVPNLKSNDRLLLALNDNLADGTDVSWIWDTDFEQLSDPKKTKKTLRVGSFPHRVWDIIVSGIRADDMAVRLKYAGFDSKHMRITRNLENGFLKAKIGLKGRLFILPTYTAMLELQKILVKQGIKKDYWKDDN